MKSGDQPFETTIDQLSHEHIQSVYLGRNGACSCGCAGTHYYHPDFPETAKERGDKVNKSMVGKVLNSVRNASIHEIDETYVAVVVGKRIHIAYLREGVKVTQSKQPEGETMKTDRETLEQVMEAEQVADSAVSAVADLVGLLEDIYEMVGDGRCSVLLTKAQHIEAELGELAAKVAELAADIGIRKV